MQKGNNHNIASATIFALVLLLGQVIGPYILTPVIKVLHLSLGSALVASQLILLILPVCIYFMVTKLPIKETLHIHTLGLRSMMIVIVISFCVQPVVMFLSALGNLFFPNVINTVVGKMSNLPILALLAAIAMTPAICEEIAVRGVVLSGYRKLGIKMAAAISGLFFALLHGNMQQGIYAFVIGILLAYLVYITNSIFASMLCHFIINGTQSLLMSTASQMIESQGGNTGTANTVLSLGEIGMLFAIALIFTWIVVSLLKLLVKVNHGRMEVIENGLVHR